MQKAVDPSTLANASRLKPGRGGLFRGVAQAVLMIAVLAGGVAGMNRIVASAPERTPRPFSAPVLTVSAVTPMPENATPAIDVFGEVVAARAVDLRPAVAGEVLSVSPNLKVGDTVQAGAEIARIDAFEYEGALVEARANLAQTSSAIVEIEARIAAERDQLAAAEE